jgi:vacuolar-type H+-ATPase subunit I/STV1
MGKVMQILKLCKSYKYIAMFLIGSSFIGISYLLGNIDNQFTLGISLLMGFIGYILWLCVCVKFLIWLIKYKGTNETK